ncbi:MAG TPA: sigma-70 family RNA polymerase sigma factor [Planctomycetota bacterium]|jgi:RNA polymerase sigma-70 factor (ECF subfamily)|nr:sigma-70 family RNA polymerase sigma factor [Planctomycetota bacterium]
MAGLRDLSDEALALRARTEPRAAFEILFERHRGPLYNFLLRQGADEARVDDLFQMAFLKAFRAIPTFREEARFKTWLYTIAVNVLQDDRRAAVRRGATTEIRETMLVAEPETGGGEDVDRVKEALGRVAPNHRQLFTLVRFQGLSIAEAAKAVGMTPAAAKVTLFRTTKRIGEMLMTVKVKR